LINMWLNLYQCSHETTLTVNLISEKKKKAVGEKILEKNDMFRSSSRPGILTFKKALPPGNSDAAKLIHFLKKIKLFVLYW